MNLSDFICKKTEKKIIDWQQLFNVKVIIIEPSKSRLGVFIPKRNIPHLIRINNNLNKYAFLITLIHEMAHASIWVRYGRNVNPHGIEWKEEFQKMMLPFINPSYFPDNILGVLSNYMINPKASTFRDLKLSEALRKYDNNISITINQISDGDIFTIDNGKKFKRISKLRKNYQCIELDTHKTYRFSPLAEVFLV